MVTPLRRSELTLGKDLPAIGLGMLNSVIMFGLGLAVLGAPMNGSPLLLAFLTLLFVTTVVGWGLVISAISRTQQQAILIVVIQAMVEITFSGLMVPVKNMPPLLQAIARIVPLRYYLEIVRGVMLKGAGLDVLGQDVLALMVRACWYGPWPSSVLPGGLTGRVEQEPQSDPALRSLWHPANQTAEACSNPAERRDLCKACTLGWTASTGTAA